MDIWTFGWNFFICGLFTYYVATALAERGPFDIFSYMRLPIYKKFQQKLDEENHGRVKHSLWELATCPKCLSIYVATLPTFGYLAPTFNLTIVQSILVLFAVAGISRFLYSHEQ